MKVHLLASFIIKSKAMVIEEVTTKMRLHKIRAYTSAAKLPKEEQLAWKLAKIASSPTKISDDVCEMVINRIIDNASVAIASLNHLSVANARSQALAHPEKEKGATIFGLSNQQKVQAEWAAWANCTAVKELDCHDTFLDADYSHPADNIPPVLAVAQQMNKDGKALLEGLVTAYEIHVSLVKAICLHKHKIDHIAHLCPAQVAGIGALLGLDTETIYQAIQQAVHLSITTRQSHKGEISSWKTYAPAHAAKLAIEAVDRAMRGEKSPSPVYEGEDSIMAWLLDGPKGIYRVPLINIGEEKRAILETYTKEYSAEYQSQAFIDLAFRMRKKITDFSAINRILISTSHYAHFEIGTGSYDPQKFNPEASREVLDHSLMYIFAVALQDGEWHHVKSYLPERAQRKDTVTLWKKIYTVEDPNWTALYHSVDPDKRALGGKVTILFKDGSVLEDELRVANAHPKGARPFFRKEYIRKFDQLTFDIISEEERNRFLKLAEKLRTLSADETKELNVQVTKNFLLCSERDNRGIF